MCVALLSYAFYPKFLFCITKYFFFVSVSVYLLLKVEVESLLLPHRGHAYTYWFFCGIQCIYFCSCMAVFIIFVIFFVDSFLILSCLLVLCIVLLYMYYNMSVHLLMCVFSILKGWYYSRLKYVKKSYQINAKYFILCRA